MRERKPIKSQRQKPIHLHIHKYFQTHDFLMCVILLANKDYRQGHKFAYNGIDLLFPNVYVLVSIERKKEENELLFITV